MVNRYANVRVATSDCDKFKHEPKDGINPSHNPNEVRLDAQPRGQSIVHSDRKSRRRKQTASATHPVKQGDDGSVTESRNSPALSPVRVMRRARANRTLRIIGLE